MKLKMHLQQIAIKKALQSNCTYRVSAIGLNKKGEIIYSTINRHRFNRKGGGVHAEMQVMLKSPKSLRTIIICRVGRSGDILPIHPCDSCKQKAKELNIKIFSISSI